MAKFSNDLNADELLNRIKNNTAEIVLCFGQPANYNEATTNVGSTVPGGGTARRLGHSTMSSTRFTGPAAGDVNGRKLTTNQQTGVPIDITSSSADHVSLITTSTASELLVVTTITTPQAVSSGNTATINAFDYEVADPT